MVLIPIGIGRLTVLVITAVILYAGDLVQTAVTPGCSVAASVVQIPAAVESRMTLPFTLKLGISTLAAPATAESWAARDTADCQVYAADRSITAAIRPA